MGEEEERGEGGWGERGVMRGGAVVNGSLFVCDAHYDTC